MSEHKKVNVVVGRVVSNKMDKTITVLVARSVKHPMYGKNVKRSTRLEAHDPSEQCNEGDLVSIQECKPIARTKNWKLVEVLEKALTPRAYIYLGGSEEYKVVRQDELNSASLKRKGTLRLKCWLGLRPSYLSCPSSAHGTSLLAFAAHSHESFLRLKGGCLAG